MRRYNKLPPKRRVMSVPYFEIEPEWIKRPYLPGKFHTWKQECKKSNWNRKGLKK